MEAEILQLLKQKKTVSGTEIGKTLGISRTAVWKHISELRQAGYEIKSSPRKGYTFISAPDLLLPGEIKAGLKTRVIGQRIEHYDTVTSTQDLAKQLAFDGAAEGTIVVAEEQKGGRGRVGRNWVSLPAGIALSVILRPAIKPTEALQLPLIAGVAVVQAIGKVSKLKPQLKWPNDIILNGRKMGGILTEMSAEVDRLNWVIIGIGLNVNASAIAFPKDIKSIATSLRREQKKSVSRVELLRHILEELENLYDEFAKSGFDPIRHKWKDVSNTIGNDVIVSSAKEQITGRAVDIDSEGALILEKADGTKERIIAGDINLRLSGRTNAG